MVEVSEENWYEETMASRERAFEEHFGQISPPDQVFKPQNDAWDLVIPGFAFMRYPPQKGRDFWLYLTHGLSQSNSWDDFHESGEGGLCGCGVEFGLATPLEEAWPFTILEALADYLFSGTKPVMPSDRIASGDLMYEQAGGHLLALEDPGYPIRFEFLSGRFYIVQLVGVTAAEIKLAKEYKGAVGSAILECALRQFGIGCVTDRSRTCMSTRAGFDQAWNICAETVSGRQT